MAEICQSLRLLGTENTTLLNIIKTQILGMDIEALIYRGANVESLLYKKSYLKDIKGANYLLPIQIAQFMDCFSSAEIYEPELFQKMEMVLIEQIEMATGP